MSAHQKTSPNRMVEVMTRNLAAMVVLFAFSLTIGSKSNTLLPSMKAKADWLAWTLQGILGGAVGLVVGVCVLLRRHGVGLLNHHLILPFLIGSSLIGAGLGSRFGDRLWIGDNYLVIPPDEPEQSPLSDWLSWGLVASGIATCVLTVLKQFRIV